MQRGERGSERENLKAGLTVDDKQSRSRLSNFPLGLSFLLIS